MEVPGWYVQLAADEAELDARIREQSKPTATRICGMSYAGYGGCVKPAGHANYCEDVYGYLFTGKPERKPCDVCGLSHRAICPSGPGVADILSVPTPEPSFDLLCEEDDE